MTGVGPLHLFGLTMLAVVTLAVFAGIAVWVMFAEPRYDNALIDQMRGPSARYRDETRRIAPFFPAGMSSRVALAMLRQNGFSCSPLVAAPVGATPVDCLRKVSSFACYRSYKITILFNNAVVKDVMAVANVDCM